MPNPVHKESFQLLSVPKNSSFPNSKLPLIVYKNVIQGSSAAHVSLFRNHLWENSWVNGIYSFHHYHSTAHEVLGVCSGWVRAQFGGDKGQILQIQHGDVVVIPAGVAHKKIDQSPDFLIVGAYPRGQRADMQYGKKGERPDADNRINMLSLPQLDRPGIWKTRPY